MKGLSNAVKVGILVIIGLGGAYSVWKTVGSRPSAGGDFALWAHFKDAAGLPEGSGVVIAGLPVGEISDLAVDGRYAKITFQIRSGTVVWSNAVVLKKSSSLLGNYYLEVDPGTPQSIDAAGKVVDNQRLESGDQIRNVVEATSPDELMRRINETMPRVDAVLLSVRDLSEDVRALVNGPIASMANRLDRLVDEESKTIARILDRTDQAIARIDSITRDIKAITSTADERVNNILSNIDDASKEAKELVTSARREVEETGKTIREKLDMVDDVIESTGSVMDKIDNDQGTLGRLVNDSTLADNLEDITEDAKGFLGTLFGMQTYVGLRTEYNVFAGLARSYVTVELYTRPDKFYLIEFERGPRGLYPETEVVFDPILDPAQDTYRKRVTIKDKTRITFQFAKRVDWLTLRFGIKESSGGIGVDGQWFDDRVKLSLDMFDAAFNDLPRLKVAAAIRVWEYLYLVGGVDDALNKPVTFDLTDPAIVGAAPPPLPVVFDEIRFGRDYFFGAYVRFNDLDLTALLTIGSGILLAAAE